MAIMSRRIRVDGAGATHHVVLKGVDGQPIFHGDEDRLEVDFRLHEIHEMYGIEVNAYCLMTNHLHLVLHCPDGGLSLAMKKFGESLAMFVNRRIGRTGHLFGNRFYSSVIETDHYFLCAVRYVERNALDLPGVERPGDHRWSSFRSTAGLRRGPRWLDSERVLGYFADRQQYRVFIERDLSTTEPDRIDLDALNGLVALVVDTLRGDSISMRQSRFAATLLADELGPTNRARLLRHLEFPSRRAESMAILRARRASETDPEIRSLVDTLRTQLFDSWGRDLDLSDLDLSDLDLSA